MNIRLAGNKYENQATLFLKNVIAVSMKHRSIGAVTGVISILTALNAQTAPHRCYRERSEL